jgi:hypothetical protein
VTRVVSEDDEGAGAETGGAASDETVAQAPAADVASEAPDEDGSGEDKN